MASRATSRAVLLCMLLVLAGPARSQAADESFFRVPVAELHVTEGEFPDGVSCVRRVWQDRLEPPLAWAVLDGAGDVVLLLEEVEAEFDRLPGSWGAPARRWVLSARAPAGADLTGRLFLPRDAGDGMAVVRFGLAAQEGDTAGGPAFWRDQAQAFETLRNRGASGAAWWRHREQAALRRAGADDEADAVGRSGVATRRRSGDSAQDSYDLFTGNRAIAENLALDRDLAPDPAPADARVELASIEGITIAPVDWAPLLDATPPALDPLATALPADQYALFFPSFAALVAVLDEADSNGTPLVDQFEARSVDSLARQRLERQLCLALTPLSRLLGPQLVKSVAITGSDFDLRLGTDLGILYQSDDPQALHALLKARHAAALAATPGALASEGVTGGIAWSAVRSPDRALCSYLAGFDDVVLVTNSPAQLEQLAAVRAGTLPALAAEPEYAFFRQRYVRGEAGESALLVLTDATIRRLCSPRWRILQSRRTRALALLTERAAAAIDGSPRAASGGDDEPVDDASLAAYGNLGFLTPIAELPVAAVTHAEARAYDDFRTNYQRGWRAAFDPIAVRLSVTPAALRADLTVMPLILESDYRWLADLVGNASIDPGDGDRHDGTLLHAALALDRDSEELASLRDFFDWNAEAGVDPLAWLGGCAGFWIDADPVWEELAAADASEDVFFRHLERMPVAAFAEVQDLASARAFLAARIEDAGRFASEPPAVETRLHEGMEYVRIAVKEDWYEGGEIAWYHALTSDLLIVTPHEGLLQRALARARLRAQGAAVPGVAPWPGRGVNISLSRGLLDVRFIESLDDRLRERCFSNLPILTEWHARFPAEDPVAAHERLLLERPVCPGGGTYAWNEEWHTMACSACGHPGVPVAHPPRPPALASFEALDLGLTFEHDGLRAIIELRRAAR